MTIKRYECADDIKFNERKIYAVDVYGMLSSTETTVYKLVRTNDHASKGEDNYVFQSESDTLYHLGESSPEAEINKMFERLLDGKQACCKPSAIYEFDNYIEFLKWCMNKAELVGANHAK